MLDVPDPKARLVSHDPFTVSQNMTNPGPAAWLDTVAVSVKGVPIGTLSPGAIVNDVVVG
jgi:hypothetical protein